MTPDGKFYSIAGAIKKHEASVTRLQAQIDALTAQLAKAEAALPEISVLFALAEAGNVVESDIIEHDCRVLAERIRRYHAEKEGNHASE